MTRALVVYESMFGNTRRIAQAVAEGLSTSATVDVVEVGAAPPLLPDDVDLLVVGGPTHAFGLSRKSTRESAAEQAVGGIVSTGIGLREWLDALDDRHPTARVAAFDTRMKAALLSGSAARRALGKLCRLGFTVAARPESFAVTGTRGPLRDGEVDRARQWGARIAADQGPTTPCSAPTGTAAEDLRQQTRSGVLPSLEGETHRVRPANTANGGER